MKICIMKNLSKNRLILLAIIVISIVGCRKDIPPLIKPVENCGCTEAWCDSFPPTPEIGFNYTMEGTQYLAPSFNPNNANEFVYLRWNGSNHAELVIYNITSGVESVILDPMSLGRPQWGKSGFIIFQYSDNCIWKIQPDGSNLTKLTNYSSSNPVFSPDGNYFTTFGAHPDISNNLLYQPILDLNGALVDSFKYEYSGEYFGMPMVPIDNQFNGYYCYTLNSPSPVVMVGFCLKQGDTITKLKNFKYQGTMWDAVINGSSLFFGTYWNHLSRLDLTTHEITAYRVGCKSRFYQHMSVSPDEKFLVVQKVISKPYDNDQSIDVQNEIWLVSLDSCTQSDIKLLGD